MPDYCKLLGFKVLGAFLMLLHVLDMRSQDIDVKLTIYDWVLVVCGKHVRVEGFAIGPDDKPQLYRTNPVVDVIDETMIYTTSRSYYRLSGNLNLEATVQSGFALWMAKRFFKGFPNNWKELLDLYFNYMSNQKENSKQLNKAEALEMMSLLSCEGFASKDHKNLPRPNTTAIFSESISHDDSFNKSFESTKVGIPDTVIKKARKITSAALKKTRVRSRTVTWTNKTQSVVRRRSKSTSKLHTSTNKVMKKPKPTKLVVPKFCTPPPDQELYRTRSGRHVFPPLRHWTYQRLTTECDEKGNEVVVFHPGQDCALKVASPACDYLKETQRFHEKFEQDQLLSIPSPSFTKALKVVRYKSKSSACVKNIFNESSDDVNDLHDVLSETLPQKTSNECIFAADATAQSRAPNTTVIFDTPDNTLGKSETQQDTTQNNSSFDDQTSLGKKKVTVTETVLKSQDKVASKLTNHKCFEHGQLDTSAPVSTRRKNMPQPSIAMANLQAKQEISTITKSQQKQKNSTKIRKRWSKKEKNESKSIAKLVEKAKLNPPEPKISRTDIQAKQKVSTTTKSHQKQKKATKKENECKSKTTLVETVEMSPPKQRRKSLRKNKKELANVLNSSDDDFTTEENVAKQTDDVSKFSVDPTSESRVPNIAVIFDTPDNTMVQCKIQQNSTQNNSSCNGPSSLRNSDITVTETELKSKNNAASKLTNSNCSEHAQLDPSAPVSIKMKNTEHTKNEERPYNLRKKKKEMAMEFNSSVDDCTAKENAAEHTEDFRKSKYVEPLFSRTNDATVTKNVISKLANNISSEFVQPDVANTVSRRRKSRKNAFSSKTDVTAKQKVATNTTSRQKQKTSTKIRKPGGKKEENGSKSKAKHVEKAKLNSLRIKISRIDIQAKQKVSTTTKFHQKRKKATKKENECKSKTTLVETVEMSPPKQRRKSLRKNKKELANVLNSSDDDFTTEENVAKQTDDVSKFSVDPTTESGVPNIAVIFDTPDNTMVQCKIQQNSTQNNSSCNDPSSLRNSDLTVTETVLKSKDNAASKLTNNNCSEHAQLDPSAPVSIKMKNTEHTKNEERPYNLRKKKKEMAMEFNSSVDDCTAKENAAEHTEDFRKSKYVEPLFSRTNDATVTKNVISKLANNISSEFVQPDVATTVSRRRKSRKNAFSSKTDVTAKQKVATNTTSRQKRKTSTKIRKPGGKKEENGSKSKAKHVEKAKLNSLRIKISRTDIQAKQEVSTTIKSIRKQKTSTRIDKPRGTKKKESESKAKPFKYGKMPPSKQRKKNSRKEKKKSVDISTGSLATGSILEQSKKNFGRKKKEVVNEFNNSRNDCNADENAAKQKANISKSKETEQKLVAITAMRGTLKRRKQTKELITALNLPKKSQEFDPCQSLKIDSFAFQNNLFNLNSSHEYATPFTPVSKLPSDFGDGHIETPSWFRTPVNAGNHSCAMVTPAHLKETLGDYKFSQTVETADKCIVQMQKKKRKQKDEFQIPVKIPKKKQKTIIPCELFHVEVDEPQHSSDDDEYFSS